MYKFVLFLLVLCASCQVQSQELYLGADMSYVNEMQDCGVIYKENNQAKAPFEILKDKGGNLVRLRLWHSPAWYDGLNSGNRYSDLADVKRSIAKVKAQGMKTLLDFHLSDNWADPSKQVVPAAWLDAVDNLPVLQDSLYNYIYQTLENLEQANLLPEMIQIGNETNRGILLSPNDNDSGNWNWTRNAALFNKALDAVEDFESAYAKNVAIMLHVAGPANAEWMMDGYFSNGVTRFDWIGMSYYWAWHKPTEIADAGNVVQTLKSLYPDKEIMIVETGYIWTTDYNDTASNIISDTHPDYRPASPQTQKQWLIDMSQEVFNKGAKGVLYWEPFWLSSPCFTQWGQGSHQEHASFFDFDNNLLEPGGIDWLSYDYQHTTTVNENNKVDLQIMSNSFTGHIKIKQHDTIHTLELILSNAAGNIIHRKTIQSDIYDYQLENQPFGLYFVSLSRKGENLLHKQLLYSPD